jgi:hypothetical protein
MKRSIRAGVCIPFVLFGAAALALDKNLPAKPDPNGQQIEVTGTLETGMMAIGGETTGVELTADDKTNYELALRGKLAKQAEDLNGKRVTVKGTLRTVDSTERKGRKIISVSSLEPAADKK